MLSCKGIGMMIKSRCGYSIVAQINFVQYRLTKRREIVMFKERQYDNAYLYHLRACPAIDPGYAAQTLHIF